MTEISLAMTEISLAVMEISLAVTGKGATTPAPLI
jgi:hypothetical protein